MDYTNACVPSVDNLIKMRVSVSKHIINYCDKLSVNNNIIMVRSKTNVFFRRNKIYT